MTRAEAIGIIEKEIHIDVRCCTHEDACRFEDALRMAIAALGEQPRWISVEERLPDGDFLDKEIIVCKLNRFGGQLVYVTRFWGTNSALWNDITHWMPLPEPPSATR